jgi:membrane associated rhomboid family serine protease
MPYTEQQYKQRMAIGQSGNALTMLIAVSLVVYVGLAFMEAVWYYRFPKEEAKINFYGNVMSWFVLPAEGNKFLSKPWTIITHLFVHDNFWKIFANMLWLWTFGYLLQDLTGNRKIIPVFIYGAIGGGIAFTLASNLLPSLKGSTPFTTIYGASAGVMAVAVVTTMLSPGYRIFPLIAGGIPLWVLTAVYIVSDLAIVSVSDTGTLIHHLAGAFTGFLFVFFLRMGYDWSEWMSNFFDWITNLFNPDKPKKGKVAIKDELFYKSPADPYKKTMNLTQQRVDEILDKINQQGYNKLSEEEKDLLKRASKEGL